ncbi:hypothetical protein PLICRDRAFT_385256 [Plicaturopsis crispa FD-325 SS-3]|nr:hypothetical protein PLICRDRAFT_385256 [Plicaturopsis crispa FD-325 SS-3]
MPGSLPTKGLIMIYHFSPPLLVCPLSYTHYLACLSLVLSTICTTRRQAFYADPHNCTLTRVILILACTPSSTR